MLVIIEGPDCAGKSTLAEALAKRITETQPGVVELLHRGPPVSHPLDEYVVPLVDYRPGSVRHVICDRWHWGEVVYPGILGRESRMDPAVWWYVEAFLRSRGAFVVRPYATRTDLIMRLLRRGDELVGTHNVGQMLDGFATAAAKSVLPYVQLHHTNTNEFDLDAIIRDASERETRAVVAGGVTTYVGPHNPAFLLVGDVRNHVAGPDDRRPAFMPYPATSGHYLISALATPRMQRLGIMNACDVDDLQVTWEALNRPNMCTLGVRADVAAGGLRHSSAPHPQYVRRFHHRSQRSYGDLINGALAVHTEALTWRP